jgi:hypothetical protein
VPHDRCAHDGGVIGRYERCDRWIHDTLVLRRHRLGDSSTELKAGEGQDCSHVCMLVSRRCANITSVSIRYGSVSDHALGTLAHALRGRLTVLDLHGSKGFGALAFKAIAAHCGNLSTLQLGRSVMGTGEVNEALQLVARFCPLMQLELSDVVPLAEVVQSKLADIGCKIHYVHDPGGAAPDAPQGTGQKLRSESFNRSEGGDQQAAHGGATGTPTGTADGGPPVVGASMRANTPAAATEPVLGAKGTTDEPVGID